MKTNVVIIVTAAAVAKANAKARQFDGSEQLNTFQARLDSYSTPTGTVTHYWSGWASVHDFEALRLRRLFEPEAWAQVFVGQPPEVVLARLDLVQFSGADYNTPPLPPASCLDIYALADYQRRIAWMPPEADPPNEYASLPTVAAIRAAGIPLPDDGVERRVVADRDGQGRKRWALIETWTQPGSGKTFRRVIAGGAGADARTRDWEEVTP